MQNRWLCPPSGSPGSRVGLSCLDRSRVGLSFVALVSLSLAACSDEPASGAACPEGYVCTPPSDVGGGGDGGGAGDGAQAADGVGLTDGGGAVAQDAAGPDAAGPDAAGPDAVASDADPADAGLLDAAGPDLDGGGGDAGGADAGGAGADGGGGGAADVADPDAFFSKPVGNLYAHDKDTLYVLNVPKAAFLKVGKFSFNKKAGLVTDIALNKWGALFAITFNDLFQCNRVDAKCVWLASLPQQFNGLSFIPEGLIDPQQEVLVGIAEKGTWYRIIFSGGKVKLTALGSYGGGWRSSGDAFSVVGIGTYATLKKTTGGDNYLAEIDPAKGKIKKIVGKTGKAKGLFGLAWWAGVFYGVSSDGNIYVLDVKTGDAQVVKGISVPKGVKWWGAGVSTRASGAGG